MKAAGCRIIADPTTRSAMLVGALFSQATYWFKLLGQIKKEFRALQSSNTPAVHIPIDSSAINLRIAAAARQHNIPVCYYVAPQVWASRPWRVKTIARVVNTLCCVFPFEEKYFRDRHVNAVYVGHPMFDTPADSPAFNPATVNPPFPNDKSDPKILLMPGSRKAEITANLPPMLATLPEIKARFPNAAFVAAAPSDARAWQIRHLLRRSNTPVDIRTAVTDAAIRWADLVLVKSGTGVLQVARHHKPMLVIYAVARYKWFFAKHLINTQYIAIVNILANRQLVPEFIPFHGSPAKITRAAIDLLSHPDLRSAMSADLASLLAPLHPDTTLAATRVANEIAKLVRS
jgi:lipid-A-disaccharide synthase